MAPYAGTRIVTFHDSWPNFAKRSRAQRGGYVEPKPGIPPSPSHTLEIINLIQSQKVPAILVEPYFDRKTPGLDRRATGAAVVILSLGRRDAGDRGLLHAVRHQRRRVRGGDEGKNDASSDFCCLPFVASLILTGIHAYLGVHVVERGVIFVDLSLAQIAALGSTMAYLLGHDLHDRRPTSCRSASPSWARRSSPCRASTRRRAFRRRP